MLALAVVVVVVVAREVATVRKREVARAVFVSLMSGVCVGGKGGGESSGKVSDDGGGGGIGGGSGSGEGKGSGVGSGSALYIIVPVKKYSHL